MKQTEIGLIPDDWEVKRIGNVSEIFGRIGFRGYTVEDLVDEGFGAITLSPSNIQNGRMDFSNCSYISWKKYDESPEIKIANGDILLVKTGSTYGKSAIVKNLTKKATINPQFVVIKKTKCNNELLGYLIQTPTVQEQIEASIVGGAIPTLSQKQIASFKIPLSKSLAEQQRIAKALSDVDALISTTEKLIQKKKNIKQGTMQNLLTGKKRLPGFDSAVVEPVETTEYKQTELGLIPEDWEVKSLEEICTRITDGSHESPTEVENGYYMPSVKDMRTRGFDFSECKKISESDYQKLVQNGCKPEIDDVLIAKDGSILKYSFAIEEEMNIVILSSIAILRPNTSFIDSSFLALYFQQEDFVKSVIDNNKTGTGVPRIVLTNFKKINIAIPSKAEQTAIANVLSSMDKEIETLNTKLEKYRNLKTAMMQQLLTGKIRLV